MKMDFILGEINRKATRKEVEKKLGKLHFYIRVYEIIPSITSSYSFSPSGPNNQFNSKVENAAIENVENERMKKLHQNEVDKTIHAINRLNEMEREILYKEYLNDDYRFNYEIYTEIGISETKYYELKSNAFYTLAFMLNIQVYKDKAVSV